MKAFQYDRPTFIRIPFFTRGKTWDYDEHFPWKEMSIPTERVEILFNSGSLYQSEEVEQQLQVGDGLEVLDITALHELVDDYIARVKVVTKTDFEFNRRKPAKSKITDKQRGLIRSWRRNNLPWLEKAEQVK